MGWSALVGPLSTQLHTADNCLHLGRYAMSSRVYPAALVLCWLWSRLQEEFWEPLSTVAPPAACCNQCWNLQHPERLAKAWLKLSPAQSSLCPRGTHSFRYVLESQRLTA